MSKNKLSVLKETPVVPRELELKSIERWKGQLLDSGLYTESQAQEVAERISGFARFVTNLILKFTGRK